MLHVGQRILSSLYSFVSPSSLIAAQLYAIFHIKGNKIFLLFALTSTFVPFTLSLLLMADLLGWEVYRGKAPIFVPRDRGFVLSPNRLPVKTSTV
jgi:hypothetical protein